jgi:hypothetical protein
MNKKAAQISLEYTTEFRSQFDQYMAIRARNPFEALQEYRRMLFRLGLLVEIWVTIEKHFKEKTNG